jgi:hypothetical protein
LLYSLHPIHQGLLLACTVTCTGLSGRYDRHDDVQIGVALPFLFSPHIFSTSMQSTAGDSSTANQRTPLVRNRSSRRPRPLRRRSSGFDQGLYSASAYKVIEAPLKRSHSQTSLQAGIPSGAVLVQQRAEQAADDKDALTAFKLLLLTICMAGVQFTCKLLKCSAEFPSLKSVSQLIMS